MNNLSVKPLNAYDDLALMVCRSIRKAGSIDALCEELDFAIPTIKRWLAGKQFPTDTSIETLMNYLGELDR